MNLKCLWDSPVKVFGTNLDTWAWKHRLLRLLMLCVNLTRLRDAQIAGKIVFLVKEKKVYIYVYVYYYGSLSLESPDKYGHLPV